MAEERKYAGFFRGRIGRALPRKQCRARRAMSLDVWRRRGDCIGFYRADGCECIQRAVSSYLSPFEKIRVVLPCPFYKQTEVFSLAEDYFFVSVPDVFQLFFDRLSNRGNGMWWFFYFASEPHSRTYRRLGTWKFCRANSIIEFPLGNVEMLGSVISFLVGFGVCISTETDGISSLKVWLQLIKLAWLDDLSRSLVCERRFGESFSCWVFFLS